MNRYIEEQGGQDDDGVGEHGRVRSGCCGVSLALLVSSFYPFLLISLFLFLAVSLPICNHELHHPHTCAVSVSRILSHRNFRPCALLSFFSAQITLRTSYTDTSHDSQRIVLCM